MRYDIIINQGATFLLDLIYKDDLGYPIDLTGYTARMMLRRYYSDISPVISLISGDEITIDPLVGGISIRIEADDSAAIESYTYVYDLEIESLTGFVTRLIQGDAAVMPEATK